MHVLDMNSHTPVFNISNSYDAVWTNNVDRVPTKAGTGTLLQSLDMASWIPPFITPISLAIRWPQGLLLHLKNAMDH